MTTAVKIIFPSTDYKNYIAVARKVIRIIYRCKNKNCKHIWAYEYRKCYTFMGGPVGTGYLSRHEGPRYDFYRITDGDEKNFKHHTCPQCGSTGAASNEVKGTTTDKKWGGTCRNAKGGDCECACGGENHGVGHVVKK